MEKEKDWQLLTERIFHIRGRKPGRLAIIAILVSVVGLWTSILALYLTGRFLIGDFTLNMILSTVAISIMWGVFGWSTVFLKNAYFDTITNLSFKNEEDKLQFYRKESVYETWHGVVGVVIATILIGAILNVLPIFQLFFPLTTELIPVFIFQLITWAIVGLLAAEAVAVIPTLIRVPKRLKDYIVINPLKPDRCGGAKAIGDFFFVFTVMTAEIGSLAIVVSGYLMIDIVGYLVAGFLMILALVVFLVPQLSIRDILRTEKSKRLEEMSKKSEILRSPSAEMDKDALMVSFIQVQSLIMLYGEVEKLREFPFETSTMRKVVTTSFLPFLLKIALDIFQIA